MRTSSGAFRSALWSRTIRANPRGSSPPWESRVTADLALPDDGPRTWCMLRKPGNLPSH
ncbi:hypothetical protein [Streptomyces sp. NPDC002851]